MKIAIVSDFHFGYNEDALPQALDALTKAASMADAAIIAGDVFDSRVPRQETVNEGLTAFNFFAGKMREKNVSVKIAGEEGEKETALPPVVCIYGTHERRTKGLVNAIQLLESSGLCANAHGKIVVLEKKRDFAQPERVAVQGMGGIPDEYAKAALDALAHKPVAGAFNFFVFHQTLQEIIPQAGSLPLRFADLPDGFDVYVDGHIHWKSDSTEAGKRVLIPGSTVVTQMRKREMEPKGFFLFDTLSGKCDFIEIASRPFEFVELEFKEAQITQIVSQTDEAIKTAYEKHAGRMPQIKVKINGTLSAGLQNSNVDLAPLSAKWAGKAKISFDKELESKELKEKIERLRRIREEKKSVRELGLEILREKISAHAKQNPQARLLENFEEELFDLLSENKVEDALKKISGNKNA